MHDRNFVSLLCLNIKDMTKIVGIYKITSPSGKIYIGQSWDIQKRWNSHKVKKKGTPKLISSFIKHGFDKHVFEILHELPHDVDQGILDEYEKTYIHLHKKSGYELLNLQDGGRGGRHSKESRLKMSKSQKDKGISENQRQKMREGVKKWWVGKLHNSGEKSPFSKLNAESVLNIRKEYLLGNTSTYKLANKYNVHSQTIWLIIKNKKWKHVK